MKVWLRYTTLPLGIDNLVVTDEGRISGSYLGHGSVFGTKPMYCPYKAAILFAVMTLVRLEFWYPTLHTTCLVGIAGDQLVVDPLGMSWVTWMMIIHD